MTEQLWTEEEHGGAPETEEAVHEETVDTETVQAADIVTVDEEEGADPRVEIEKTEEAGKQDPRREIYGAVGGAALAVLFLTIGFWKTLFIAVMGGAGAFLFGISDKQQVFKDLVNRLFPPKD